MDGTWAIDGICLLAVGRVATRAGTFSALRLTALSAVAYKRAAIARRGMNPTRPCRRAYIWFQLTNRPAGSS